MWTNAIPAALALLLLLTQPAPTATPPAAAAATRPVATQPAANADRMVTIVPGDMPLLISAPHGGTLRIPGVDNRTGDGIAARRGAKTNFTMVLDKNTDRLALRVADEIFKQTGHRPYLVIARFTRQEIDANRPPEDAYESPLAKPIYDEYQGAIQRFRDEILARYHCGLLVDIHGHGGDPAAVIRGTGNWRTVRHLVEAFGKGALTGPDGLLAPLAEAGNKLVPPNDSDDAMEDKSLNGGYIVRHYGSLEGSDFDAIQLEMGAAQRSAEGIDKFGPELAGALVKFRARYLKPSAASQPASRRVANP